MTKPRLAARRRRAELTQQQLAERLGINRVQLAKYEAGAQIPSVGTATRIAEALGTSVEELFGNGSGRFPVRTARSNPLGGLEARVSELEERMQALEARRTSIEPLAWRRIDA